MIMFYIEQDMIMFIPLSDLIKTWFCVALTAGLLSLQPFIAHQPRIAPCLNNDIVFCSESGLLSLQYFDVLTGRGIFMIFNSSWPKVENKCIA